MCNFFYKQNVLKCCSFCSLHSDEMVFDFWTLMPLNSHCKKWLLNDVNSSVEFNTIHNEIFWNKLLKLVMIVYGNFSYQIT